MTPDDGWVRLDPRMLAVGPAQELVKFLPLFVVALFAGNSDSRPWFLIGALGVVVGYGVLRWVTTRYRLTAERIELRSGVLFRQHRSVPRDRVRTVDVTAKVLHRVFGLSVLRVGTGRHEPGRDGELTLDAVSSTESERLRFVLLDRSPVAVGAGAGPPDAGVADADATPGAGGPVDPGPPPVAQPDPGTELSTLSWSWLRFAPLTVLGVASIGALFGTAWQVLGETEMNIEDVLALRQLAEWAAEQPIVLAVAVLVVGLLVVGSLGAVALYVEAWWGYRLTRQRDGTLQVNRGLLTRRSVSLEERRLRGVAVAEPLLLRAGRGARCTAVATGSGSGDRASLLPPAPRAEAHRVAAVVLREDRSPTLHRLLRHPPAALRRRLFRALAPAAVVVAALGVLDWLDLLPTWPWIVAAVVLLPAAVLLGVDRYRNLGHVETEEYLVIRSGSLLRQTVALRRTGVIGWRISQSVFQRGSGLATATAVTAAGSGAYQILDIAFDDAMRLADRNQT